MSPELHAKLSSTDGLFRQKYRPYIHAIHLRLVIANIRSLDALNEMYPTWRLSSDVNAVETFYTKRINHEQPQT